jgi:hypothetical protein
MIVEVHNKLGQPQRIEATRVLIRDVIDGPIAMIVEVGPRHYFYVDREDGDVAMNRALQSMGIKETVLSDVVTELPRPEGTLWTPGDQDA